MTTHIALLGDSIFDNGVYTDGAPDVVTHLRSLLPPPTRATLLAIDGSVTSDLAEQLSRVPGDASHLVISLGGNDALGSADLLMAQVDSTAETLMMFGSRLAPFEAAYTQAIDAALALGRRTTLCTIYNGNLELPEAPLARIALMMFNDVILRTAIERQLPVIDLRFVCDQPEHYANPIEPSDSGGREIAKAILSACLAHEPLPHSQVFAG